MRRSISTRPERTGRDTRISSASGGKLPRCAPALALLWACCGLGALAQPTAPVHVIAEWEPAVGTLISWPLGIPRELVEELARDDMLYVLVMGPNAENQARQTFQAWGIDPLHLEFIHTSVQSHWPRDWGPHQVFDASGEWTIIDPIFHGYPWVPPQCEPISSPGGHTGDDAVNSDVAAHFGAPLHWFPAYLTGGNFLVDGEESAFSTCAMLGENNQLWTDAEFLDLAEQYVGIKDYVVLGGTENNGIQHIDCWLKVVDEETLLVKRAPPWHEEYERIRANLKILAAARTRYDRPYRILRIDTPPYNGYAVAAYTNSMFLNDKVLVPLFGIDGDAEAIATFEAAMPGYDVIGFPWDSWYYYDALHCRARAIFDRHMIRMSHRRLPAWVPDGSDHRVTASIDDRSEAGLDADALRVYWREAGTTGWNWALLEATAEPDRYSAAIPAHAAGTTVEYYLAAADLGGRTATVPPPAPAGTYSFTVGCGPVVLTLDRSELSWTGLEGALGYDVVWGDLDLLRDTAGDFSLAAKGCAANDHAGLTVPLPFDPTPGRNTWFLVRAVASSGNASYSFGLDCERVERDNMIDIAVGACP